ncbi:hypothetical protein [Primorskyibacter flagellatus]|uniref:Uncharacterized protein n=1 Tax=Primorskyibacter flagellatus TaxID=1387277 RepID=A0A1W2ESY2_9RHOB|nr:hypothetical protein [Primorskyibacter flagellatus]SMD12288.1 hypothetical protein SAMN06295998_1402 [Primorskyibacter flagellatus]
MNDEDTDNEKPKSFDISKLTMEMRDEDRAAADERLREQFKEMTEGNDVMKDALRGIGGVSALQDAMGSVNSLQDAIKASGIGSVQEQVRDAMSGLATSGIQDDLSALRGAGVFDQLNAEHAAMEEARKSALGVLPEGYIESLTGASGAAALAASGLQDRMRGLGLGEDSSFSRIAAGIAEQQSVLDRMHQDRFEVSPALRDIHIPENPLIETNKRLERIERRFDQISHVAETSAQTATELQLAAAEFLKDFKEAASKNDEAAADAIRLGKGAVWAAILIPFLVFGAQYAANTYLPNREAEALQQSVTGLKTEIDAMQAADAAQTERLIDAIAASDEATAAAILEGLRALQPPAADTTPIAD